MSRRTDSLNPTTQSSTATTHENIEYFHSTFCVPVSVSKHFIISFNLHSKMLALVMVLRVSSSLNFMPCYLAHIILVPALAGLV